MVEFKGHRRSYFHNPESIAVAPGDFVIVEADRGEDAGEVRALLEHSPLACQVSDYRLMRKATESDLERIQRHRTKESDALSLCQGKIAVHRLSMALVDAEIRFDELKLTFYFTADGRIDFRELVRDLASAFRTRIELRQIGARDEVKRGDGFGICGRRLCCVSFLDAFQPITTTMAKSQKLILNPTKLSGSCGRLKCCLSFEADSYCGADAGESSFPVVLDPDGRIDHLSD